MHKHRRDFIFIIQKINFKERKGDYLEMSRVYNFSAGPAVLPVEVLEEAAKDMGAPLELVLERLKQKQ